MALSQVLPLHFSTLIVFITFNLHITALQLLACNTEHDNQTVKHDMKFNPSSFWLNYIF